MNAKDIATVPPVDKNGEMKKAAALLTRFRKQIVDVGSVEWQRWVANSLLQGLPQEESK